MPRSAIPAISRSRIRSIRAWLRFEPIAWRNWSASAALKPGAVDRELHELFLEQRHAERLLQARLRQRMDVGDLLLAVAAPQVGMHRTALDRAGPDERDLDHEVVETTRPQARQRRHLRPALHLEHTDGVGRAQEVVHLVLLRDRREVDVDALAAHHVDREVQHRQHAEAEQVELHQSRGRAVVLVPLEHRTALHARPLDRAELHERPVGHHHAAGVDAEVAGKVDHRARELERERRDRGRARRARRDRRAGHHRASPGLAGFVRTAVRTARGHLPMSRSSSLESVSSPNASGPAAQRSTHLPSASA